jgi:site-specific DNA recombinase
VVNQIRRIGQDSALIRETAQQVKEIVRRQKKALQAEQKRLRRDLAKKRGECRRLLDTVALGKASGPTITDRLSELEEHAQVVEGRLAEIAHELDAITQQTFNQSDLTTALSLFDPIWGVLYPVEQARITQLLINKIDYDGAMGKMTIVFQPTGIQTMAAEVDTAIDTVIQPDSSIPPERVNFKMTGVTHAKKDMEYPHCDGEN